MKNKVVTIAIAVRSVDVNVPTATVSLTVGVVIETRFSSHAAPHERQIRKNLRHSANDMLISSALNPVSRDVAQVSATFIAKPDCTSTMSPKTHRLGFR